MSKSSVPRLKDVANEANVSISAASRILRGETDRFGKETCARVVDAARRLGWRRNLLVDGMQTGRTQTIGVLVPPFDSYWTRVLCGIHSELASRDYLPITVWIGNCLEDPHYEENEEEGLRQISRLLDRRVDGLILWPAFAIAYYDHFRELVERNVPVAVIDHVFSRERIADSIETDEQRGAEEVAQHLLTLGHRRIACLSSREVAWQAWSIRRRKFFEEAVTRVPGTEFTSGHLNPQGSDGLEVAMRILQHESQPTAVFAVTDHEAQFVYEAADRLGRKIPTDLSVAGFADLDFAAVMNPPLTSYRQNPREMGRLAAERIVDRLDGELTEADFESIHVAGKLIVRESTAPAPS
jgi:LacI family transcriptional regulator